MGQLRKEVEPEVGEGKPSSRRFQPPRRKIGERKQPTPARAPSPRPGADVEVGSENAPSAEMAWLLRAKDRMDAEASEVATFLVGHNLEQYVPLLVDSPGALGSSMEALRGATEEMLAEAGLPASPRFRLLHALDGNPTDHPASGHERIAGNAAASPEPSPKWGRLGRVPPGWNRCTPVETRATLATRAAPVAFADACTGDDSQIPAEDDQNQQVSASSQADTATASDAATAAVDLRPRPPSAPFPPQRPPSSAARISSRPGTATSVASRPGTSSGTSQKACCYQCYRQVYASSALQLPPEEEAEASRPATPATPASAAGATGMQSQRLFCSEVCIAQYRQDRKSVV